MRLRRPAAATRVGSAGFLAALLVTLAFSPAVAIPGPKPETPRVPSPIEASGGGDIVGVLQANPDFKVLTRALAESDLAAKLKNKGPFTLLAPTDGAFAKLPAEVRDALFKPENRGVLASVLTRHVIHGKRVGSNRIMTAKGFKAKTAVGDTAAIDARRRGGVRIGAASLVKTDTPATNGIIHGIDTVIVPHQAALVLARGPASEGTVK